MSDTLADDTQQATRNIMTLASSLIRTLLQAKPPFFPSRVSLRAFNSTASCQPSVEACDHSGGEVHEESGTPTEIVEQSRQELWRRDQAQPSFIAELEANQGRIPSSSANLEAHQEGTPLRIVVRSCVKRWFKEYLTNAEKGDSDAQAAVGQMMCVGYGVVKDVQKGEEWIRKSGARRKTLKQSKEPHEKKRPEDEDFFFV